MTSAFPRRYQRADDIKRRIAASIDIDGRTGCWNWRFRTDRWGYPRICLGKNPINAHRVSYVAHKGEIPDGLIVRHMCHNTRCVNPEHMALGTHKQNMMDRAAKYSAQAIPMFTPGRKLTLPDVEWVKRAVAYGLTIKDIARSFGVAPNCIQNIKSGKSWKSVPPPTILADSSPRKGQMLPGYSVDGRCPEVPSDVVVHAKNFCPVGTCTPTCNSQEYL